MNLLFIDFGLETLAGRTDFPWLMSNVMDKETGSLLADGKETFVIEHLGRRIGLIGLVEKEWIETLPTITPEQVDYMDFVETGSKLAKKLKVDEGNICESFLLSSSSLNL